MTQEEVPAIDVRGLWRRFGEVSVLRGLDLTVPACCVHGFLGVNGAGKTTTMRVLYGFIQADRGSVRILGEELRPERIDIRRRMAYLPQHAAFYPWMNGREYLELCGTLLDFGRNEVRRRAAEALERVGLADVGRRRIAGWSAGQKQRLGLAKAALGNPEVLLLDEPVSALDPVGRKVVLEFIEDLGRHAAVLVSIHVLEDIERVSSRITILHEGKARITATVQELRSRFVHQAFDLKVGGDPTALIEALRARPWTQQVELDTKNGGDPTLRVTVRDLAAAQRGIPAEVVRLRLRLVSFQAVPVSLEQIFLSVTGERGA